MKPGLLLLLTAGEVHFSGITFRLSLFLGGSQPFAKLGAQCAAAFVSSNNWM
jgi:hypothetical protein